MQPNIIVGNAAIEGCEHRGWFIGHFLSTKHDPRSTSELEVKWGIHSAGEGRTEWGVSQQATTISILISGHFCIEFRDRVVWLSQPGDYVLWLPGVAHTWFAEAPSTILSIRYPSLPTA